MNEDRKLRTSLNNVKFYLAETIGYIDIARDSREHPKALEKVLKQRDEH